MLPFGGVIYGRLKVFVVEDFFVTAYEQAFVLFSKVY